MNATTLLDNFELIADAPGGVPKLRELILQLAVRGKLVPQDPKDVAVQVAGLTDTTEPESKYAIPSRWIWTRLGSVIDYNYGGKTESERIPADAWLLDLEDIEKDTSRLLQRVLAGNRKSTSTKSQFSAGDVLYGKLRPYLNKVLVANSDGYCTTEIVPMKPLKGVNSHYVVCVLKSQDFLDYTAARSYGMKMPRLGTEDAKRAPFPLPPLSEQKRIVAKVDELMRRCDELETRQKERAARHKALVSSCLNAVSDPKKGKISLPSVALAEEGSFNLLFTSPESIAELRKTILQLAVQGRLVPQDSREEPTETLLDAIHAERAKRVRDGALRERSDYISPLSPQPSAPVPIGWVNRCFGSLVFNRDGERVPVSQADREKRRGEFDYYGASGVIDKIDDYIFDQPLLLIGEDGANLVNRSTPIAFIAAGKYWVNNHAHVLEAVNDDLLNYLTLFINATDLSPYITGTAQPKMNQSKMNSIPVALPPLAEQKRIVAKVNELMAMCDKLETTLTQSNKVAEKLAEAVV